jgi:hypothetical protein
MLKPGEGSSIWSMFVRTYSPDLSTITYSTILRGPWDPATGKSSGGEIKILHAVPAGDKLVIVGHHAQAEAGPGDELKSRNIPSWAGDAPAGPTSAVIAIVER